MDPRRRPPAFNGPSGFSAIAAGPRSSSLQRRRPPPGAVSAHNTSALDLGPWAKDRRPYQSEGSMGLSRQASAPNLLAPSGGANTSFDYYPRPPIPGANVDMYSRSPGLKRSSSAAAVIRPSSQGRTGGSFSSLPKRRPYETGTPLYATPERDLHGGARAGAYPIPPSGYQQKADAMQMEMRLTERLREQVLHPSERTRRPTADQRRPMQADGQGKWASHVPWADGVPGGYGMPGYPLPQEPYAVPMSYHGSTSASPARSAAQLRPSGSPWHATPGPRVPHHPHAHSHGPHEGTPATRPMHSQTPSPFKNSHVGSHYSGVGMEEEPESRLKIYSDLFEEVIERDRVFGSLLRKVKTAYDSMLVRPQEASHLSVPPMPSQESSLLAPGHASNASYVSASHGRRHAPGPPLPSGEPTIRTEDAGPWELQRENQVLKDLVERLHLELEEAVKRESRWKQKAVKLKARSTAQGPPPPMMPPPLQALQSSVQGATDGLSQDVASLRSMATGLRAAGHFASGYSYGGSEGHWQTQERPFEKTINLKATSPGSMAASRSFQPNRREPNLGDEDVALNQGGFLSLSSISPQHSQPAPHESMEGISGTETARSTDSGMLPQRPTRRLVVKPAHVPTLDFSRLKLHEEEEEEEMEEVVEGQEGEEEYDEEHLADLELQSDSEGYSPREEDEDEMRAEHMPHGTMKVARGQYQYAEDIQDSD